MPTGAENVLVAVGQLLNEPAFHVIEQTGGWVITTFRVPLTAEQPLEFVVNLSTAVPVKFAAGVYVTVAGLFVCAVVLRVPPPETMDHAPVVAPPPTVAPVRVIGTGLAEVQAARSEPGVTVGKD
jgi:hypothetical protein